MTEDTDANRKVNALLKEHYEIDQILGKALGYPEYDESVMEDPDGSVCTGEHTPVTLAMEAATALQDARQQAFKEAADMVREVRDKYEMESMPWVELDLLAFSVEVSR